ncbi:hypothetical protein BJX96DRAFT_97351 [Aspergillus floccosus]
MPTGQRPREPGIMLCTVVISVGRVNSSGCAWRFDPPSPRQGRKIACLCESAGINIQHQPFIPRRISVVAVELGSCQYPLLAFSTRLGAVDMISSTKHAIH